MLSLALFMALLDVSIVTVALPSIQVGIGASDADVQWVMAGYALAFGVVQVPTGRAGDLFGRERLFVLGVATFTGASLWAGFSADPLMLNLARVLEGLGAGLLLPQVVGMIQQYFRGAERGRAFGIFGGVVGVAVAIGPTLGGLLITIFGVHDGWRAVFFVNLPVGVVTVALALTLFPKGVLTRRRESAHALVPGDRSLDPIGVSLLGIGILAILFPIVQSGASALTWLLLPVGLALVAAWVWWERRYRDSGRAPMVDLGIFRVPGFRNGIALIGLYYFGMGAIWVVLALYFQEGLGHSALASGLLGLPSAIMTGLWAVWAGRRIQTYGRRIVTGGITVALVGLAASMLVVYLNHSGLASAWWLLLTLAVFGAGGGLVVSPNQTLTLEEVPIEYAGSSGGVMQTSQQIGTSIGIAVVTTVSVHVLGASHNWPIAFLVGLAVIGALMAAALAVARLDLHQRHGAGTARGPRPVR